MARGGAGAAAARRLRVVESFKSAADAGNLEIYLDARADYRTAQANIAEHGAIVLHPRTGAPLANPYLVVRSQAIAVMRKCRLKDDPLWAADAAAEGKPAG